MTPRQTDVLVIGGGAIGVCAAHYLAAAGRQVTVVEKDDVCAGASYGNAGLLVPSHSVPLAEPGIARKAIRWMLDPESPFYIRPRWDRQMAAWLLRFLRASTHRQVARSMPLIRELSFASLELYDQLADLPGMDFGLEHRGWLKLFRTEAGLEEEVAAARLLAEVGIEHQVLDPTEIATVDAAAVGPALGAVHYPQDAHVDPSRFVGALADHTRSQGVEIISGAEVLGFDTREKRIQEVRTTRGAFAPGEVVLAAGAWTPMVGDGLGLRLPMQPAKGYSATFKRPSEAPQTPIYCAEAKVATTPLGDHLRFAGTLELAGYDMTVNEVRVRALMRAVPAYVPALDPDNLELVEIWRGWRPCTPDGLPYLGRSQRVENLVLAAGHAMVGISLAPITGKLVTELVTGTGTSVDLTLTRVERYD